MVDKQDFQIVLVNGRTVPQDMRRGHEDLQPPFTTYYEQVDGKYWVVEITYATDKNHPPDRIILHKDEAPHIMHLRIGDPFANQSLVFTKRY